MQRYWISGVPGNWTNTANWSTFSGGPGGASIPIYDSTAIFDLNGTGDCTLDASAWISGLQLSSGYIGSLSQNSYEMLIGDAGASFLDGTFQGSGDDIRVTGNLYIGAACQFTSTDSTLACDSTFTINPSTGSFNHNYGTVVLDGSCTFDPTDATLHTLQLDTVGGRLYSSCYVDNLLALSGGYVSQGVIGSEIHMRGDMSCGSLYNEWSESNNLNLIFDSTTKQTLYYESGCIIPTLITDKTSNVVCDEETIYVTCEGDSPIIIRGDFLLYRGKFDLNNHNIQIGI